MPEPDAPRNVTALARDRLAEQILAEMGGQFGGADTFSQANATNTLSAREALRATLCVRNPGPLPRRAAELLNQLLTQERESRHIIDAASLPLIAETHPQYAAAQSTVLWQGDITTLDVDAIVNAANSALLGCFRPFHPCIDNAIHDAAGPQLRDDCAAIIAAQGAPEPTGSCQVTHAYHLPARYVFHTVGPIVHGELTAEHAQQLASCYRTCLDAAAARNVKSIAFCSISTGVFGYPKAPASRVALDTVSAWLETNPGQIERVIFNVFSAADHETYREALSA